MSWMSHEQIEDVMKGLPQELPADAEVQRLIGTKRPGCRHDPVVQVAIAADTKMAPAGS